MVSAVLADLPGGTTLLQPLLWALAPAAAVLGFGVLLVEGARTRSLVRAAQPVTAQGSVGRLWAGLDRWLMRTRLGPPLRVAADELGWLRLRVVDLMAGIAVTMALVWFVVGSFLAWRLAPVFALLVLPAVAFVVRRERQRRKEKFIAQMPQLARVLSNATAAGLSLRTAVEIAAEELAEPAKTEMTRVGQALAFGESLEGALVGLEQRLPSREVVVLASTLIVSARAGGSLISSLRRIAETLDERKQTRREILTVLAEARSTALLIPLIGIGSLVMVRSMDATAIDRMLGEPIGQGIFAAAVVLYAVGGFLFNRVTRVKD